MKKILTLTVLILVLTACTSAQSAGSSLTPTFTPCPTSAGAAGAGTCAVPGLEQEAAETTPAFGPTLAYSSPDFGVMFIYPASYDEPGSECALVETVTTNGTQVRVGKQTLLAMYPTTQATLDAVADEFISLNSQLGLKDLVRKSGTTAGLDSLSLSYHVGDSGDVASTTLLLYGNNVYSWTVAPGDLCEGEATLLHSLQFGMLAQ